MQKRQEKDNEKAILLNIGDIQEFRDNLYEQEKAAETIRKYVADVQTLFRYLGGELCLTKRRLVEYKERLSDNYAPASVNSMIAALNQFLKYA